MITKLIFHQIFKPFWQCMHRVAFLHVAAFQTNQQIMVINCVLSSYGSGSVEPTDWLLCGAVQRSSIPHTQLSCLFFSGYLGDLPFPCFGYKGLTAIFQFSQISGRWFIESQFPIVALIGQFTYCWFHLVKLLMNGLVPIVIGLSNILDSEL